MFVLDNGVQLGVDPARNYFKSACPVNVDGLASHEEHHWTERGHGFGHRGSKAGLARPVEEMVQQPQAQPAPLVLRVAGVRVVALPDMVTEHCQCASGQGGSMAGKVGPVQRVP